MKLKAASSRNIFLFLFFIAPHVSFADSTRSVHLEEKVETFAQERASETDGNVNCPTLNVDPTPNVLDQGEAGMCASFTAHALLQSHARRYGRPPLPEDVNLSVMSINQIVETEVKAVGELDPYGEHVGHILRDVQTAHPEISTDKAFGYYWSHGSGFKDWSTRLRTQAAEYFNNNPNTNALNMRLDDSGDVSVRLRREEGAPQTGLSHDDIELLIPTGGDWEAFHASYDRRPELPSFRSNYPDKVSIPPFRTIQRSFNPSASDGSERLHDLLVEGLGSGAPMSVSVCMTQVEKDMAAAAGEPFNSRNTSACGSHAMAAVGMYRDNRGRCMVRILNSWGREWNGDGMVDIPVDRLVGYMAYAPPGKNPSTNTHLSHLAPSNERTREVEMDGALGDGSRFLFVGQVDRRSDKQIRGRLSFGQTPLGPKVIDGTLSNEVNLVSGQATNLDSHSVNGEKLYYTGQMRNGEPHGEGAFRYADGRVLQSGTFTNGTFNRGSGPSNASSGSNLNTRDLEEVRRLLEELKNR